jgi:hypothetical protein
MRRGIAAPVLLLATIACQDITAPDQTRARMDPDLSDPSFASQQGPSDTECPPAPATLDPSEPYQNIIVPEGRKCVLAGLTITGNVKVLAGAELEATDNTIAGSVQAEKAVRVHVHGGSVGGSIDIVEGPGGPTLIPGIEGDFEAVLDYLISEVRLSRNITILKNTGTIGVVSTWIKTGNLKIEDNDLEDVTLPGSFTLGLAVTLTTVNGDVHVLKNRGGSILVDENRVASFTEALLIDQTGKGNIKIEDNVVPAAGQMVISENLGAQNLQVFKNTGAGTKAVNFNRAEESVQCYENAPPFEAFANTAPKLERQCGVPPTAQ